MPSSTRRSSPPSRTAEERRRPHTDIVVLFSNLVGLFLLIAVGFAAVRLKIVPAQMSKPLSALLMNITLPATVFISMIQPYDPGFLGLGLAAIVFSAVFFSLFSALSLPLSRLCRVPDGRRGMWCCCATYSNTGFMGFPVAYALFGADGLMLAVFFNIPFNFLLYTIGVRMVCMDAPKGDAKGSFSLRTALMTPLNAAIVLSLIFYFGQLPVPDALFTPLQHLSNVTTPLSMMVTGMNLAQGKVSDVIRDRDAITSSLTRLLVFPVICWVGMRLFPQMDALVVGVTLVMLAMPSPAAAPIIGEQFNGCVQLGARVVFLSSLLCIATLPLVSLLL